MMNISHYLYNTLSLRLILLLCLLSLSIFIVQAKDTRLSKITTERMVSKFDTKLEYSELFNRVKLGYNSRDLHLITKPDQLAENLNSASLPYFKIVTIGIIAVLLLIIVVMLKRGRKHKKEIQNISKQLETHKKTKAEIKVAAFLKKTNTKVSNESGLNISMETLQRIKDKLEEFERNNLFVDPYVSALTLATYCHTNVRYVSEVINKHKGQSISTYINHLRIEYILSLLESDEGYRAYKITRLAEKAGFSSPSKFSTEFKRIVGVSPSVYIYKISQ